jgi:toxin FitB
MSKIVLFDTGPLGMVSHLRPNRDVVEWVKNLLLSGAVILVPEIADYEVRRELLRTKNIKGIRRLDDLKRTMGYVPITTEAMLKAAEFWATARRRGRPTAKHEALDGDAILAGQAVTLDIGADELVIATTNLKHLSRFASAEICTDIR